MGFIPSISHKAQLMNLIIQEQFSMEPEKSDIDKQIMKDSETYQPRQHAKYTKSKKKFKINTNRSRGELKLLKSIINANHWSEVFKDGDLMWSGIPDEDVTIGVQMKLNRIPCMPLICNKKTIGYILNKFRQYWPEMFNFYPKTYLLPEHEDKVQKKMNTGNKYYILKPAEGCQGDGVILVKKMSQIPKYGANQWIVQPYIDKPLLLDKKKFDFRLYVLISSVQPYICYLNEEGMVRLCSQEYHKPNKENMKNPYIHLTNYSLNKNHPDYVIGQQAFSRGGKRCLRVAWDDLLTQGVDVKVLKERIFEVTKKFLTGLYPFVKYYYNATFPKQEGRNFQVLGIDIMVDEDLNPWLLEANHNPSLSIEHEGPGPESKKQLSPVDEYIKRLVVQDAIYLVHMNIEKQKEMQIGENFYSWKKILDTECDDVKGMNIMQNMLRIFHSQCSIRSKWILTSSQFIKLSRLDGMTNEKITKNDYHLIFIKIMREKFNPNQMEFDAFIEAMQYIVGEVVGFTKENKLLVMQEHLQKLVAQL